MTFRTEWPKVNRRSVLGMMAAPAAVGSGAPVLPTVKIGKYEVTRLVAGYNPIGGYSHAVPKLSVIMKEWFTPGRTLEYALACERNGINTWQVSVDPKVFGALRAARERGSKIQWLCLMRDEEPAVWKEVMDLKPMAVVHHGGVTDRFFRAGEHSKVKDFVKKAHDYGVMAGVSSHNPRNIAWCEDAGWEHDLYMACFYNVTRDPEKLKEGLGDVPVDELFLANDPERMGEVIRQVKRPCLGFKIFAAGRLCNSKAQMEKAMKAAYGRIKPGDGLILGMFPMLSDEVAEDAGMARRILVES